MANNHSYENLFDLDNFDDEELRNDHSLIDEEKFNIFPSRMINYPERRKNNILELITNNYLAEESVIEEEMFFNKIEEYELKTMKEALLEYLDRHFEEVIKEEPSTIIVKKKKKSNRRSNY